jgi:hypothetical protein
MKKYGLFLSVLVAGFGPSSWKTTRAIFVPETIASIAALPVTAWPSCTPLKPVTLGAPAAVGCAAREERVANGISKAANNPTVSSAMKGRMTRLVDITVVPPFNFFSTCERQSYGSTIE